MFLGVEVTDSEPYTLVKNYGDRIRITQAVLGHQNPEGKVILQCKVGENKKSISLCCLDTEKSATVPLNVVFGEKDDVVFSIIGNGSVFLSGYFISNHSLHDDDYEREDSLYPFGSVGMDIAYTESKRSTDDDDYDLSDSFINDGDPGVLSPLPIRQLDDLLHNGAANSVENNGMVIGEDESNALLEYFMQRNVHSQTSKIEDK
ncbi:hypothetical protein RCOM_1666730 [Ricinus communis]|uniref:Nucleoplasmin-like domain-containing protein n=1 Tax=Ricinus communis TaxID=3988 RepID=B9RL57_RICCO|nr:hypothetical protein RCOM_1666730 [Ricinus communis]